MIKKKVQKWAKGVKKDVKNLAKPTKNLSEADQIRRRARIGRHNNHNVAKDLLQEAENRRKGLM